MKIAYVFYDRPDYSAGPRINAMRLLPELVRRGHHVTAIIGYYSECSAQKYLEQSGVVVRAVSWPRYCVDQVNWLAMTLSEVDPDVFVPNISTSGCYAARYLREAGRPTIAGHLSDDDYNWGLARRFCRRGDEWAVSGLFCMGRELGDVVRAWNPSRSHVVDICHGVPQSDMRSNCGGPLRLVYAGRLEDRQKRISDLARAVLPVLRTYPQAQMKFIGEGSRRSSLEDFFDGQRLADRVTFAGYVEPDTVQREMVWGNVLVLLSEYEGVPGAVMDGMACGMVPVCLDIDGGVRELVVHQQTGLLVRNREADFQSAIHRLAADEFLRRDLSFNAVRHIANHFSLTAATDEWEQLFEHLVQSAGPRRKIAFPDPIVLPPPSKGIDREDIRRPLSLSGKLRQIWRKTQF